MYDRFLRFENVKMVTMNLLHLKFQIQDFGNQWVTNRSYVHCVFIVCDHTHN